MATANGIANAFRDFDVDREQLRRELDGYRPADTGAGADGTGGDTATRAAKGGGGGGKRGGGRWRDCRLTRRRRRDSQQVITLTIFFHNCALSKSGAGALCSRSTGARPDAWARR